MKNIVVFDEYNEIDLKPSELLEKYKVLTQEDVQQLFIDKGTLKSCACPACGSLETTSNFKKFGLTYNECSHCHTLYISPRPDDAELNKFFTKSNSRKFWNKEIYSKTKTKRAEKIIKPRFEWIKDSSLEYLSEVNHFVDINANQFGYVEALTQTQIFKRKSLVNPLIDFTDQSEKTDVEIIDTPWWDIDFNSEADVVSLFEVIDRTSDVDALFAKVNQILKPQGLCFITTILGSGFDVQTLRENAEHIVPPDRLNLFTVEGLNALMERHGFQCLEFSTPGILDLEIVEKAYKANPEIKLPDFVKYLINQRDEQTKKSFQEFLQSSLLSSYARVLIRKK